MKKSKAFKKIRDGLRDALTWEKFLCDIEEEAHLEGPQATAEYEALCAYFKCLSDLAKGEAMSIGSRCPFCDEDLEYAGLTIVSEETLKCGNLQPIICSSCLYRLVEQRGKCVEERYQAEIKRLMQFRVNDNKKHEAEIKVLGKVRDAAQDRVEYGHNDTCGTMLGDYPCSCGHDALLAALKAEGEDSGK